VFCTGGGGGWSMIYFDVTKASEAGHRSGLLRVSSRLRAELGAATVPVVWDNGGFKAGDVPVAWAGGDWLLTPELFSEEERPGLRAFLDRPPCRTAALFHDAIPLRMPQVTWPQSVARHPDYMKLLARFDRVWAVSQASADELAGWWRWAGVHPRAVVERLSLGADFLGVPRLTVDPGSEQRRGVLCVGILEPRKNQDFLLDACDRLWSEGLSFDLHLVGRVNPHFGERVLGKVRRLQCQREGLRHYPAASDQKVAELYRTVRVAAFPTLAEGCGLPVLEALWMGVPCLCSDLESIRENAAYGGCGLLPTNDIDAWCGALRRVLAEDNPWLELARAARGRPLTRWTDTAAHLAGELAVDAV
jgi:glycosyltransferase involved in cell wall biosynthesis